jgi:hypothetical protein
MSVQRHTLILAGHCEIRANAASAQREQQCGSTLVTNRTDNSANNNVACELLNTRETSAARHDQVVLNDVGSSRHDIVDPTTFPQARTLVYPKLEAIVLRSKAGSARKKQFALSRLRARVRSTTEF